MSGTNQQGVRKFWWIGVVAGLVLVNVGASFLHRRMDLTAEHRYSLSTPTKTLLQNLDSTVTLDVFLTGKDLPAVVRNYRNSIQDFLMETKEWGGNKIQYRFVDPYASGDTATVRQLEDSLAQYGLTPAQLNAPSGVGDEVTIKKLIHGALVHYRGRTYPIDFLKGTKSYGTEPEELAALYNSLEAGTEYKVASAIQKITAAQRPVVAYALGNGEVWGYNADDAVRTLIADYNFDTLNIKQVPFIPETVNALVITKPTVPFTEGDKRKIDQYIMHGGNVLWMVDNMYAEFDSLYQSKGFIAFDRGLNLEDQLFTYGVRINQTLLQDMQSDKLPQVSQDGQQRRLVDWPFFPILSGSDHPITKNLDGVRALFPTSLDTVEAGGIKKTVLLQTSNNTRLLTAPAKIDFEFYQIAPDERLFRHPPVPVAVLLEGPFRSLYAGRQSRAVADSLKAYNYSLLNTAPATGKMIVVADGDVALNQFSPSTGPLAMGTNLFTRYTFANKDFFINSLEYLVNPTDILQTRSKEYTLRLLDPRKVDEQKTTWQLITIALPIVLVVLFGALYQGLRKRRYMA